MTKERRKGPSSCRFVYLTKANTKLRTKEILKEVFFLVIHFVPFVLDTVVSFCGRLVVEVRLFLNTLTNYQTGPRLSF